VNHAQEFLQVALCDTAHRCGCKTVRRSDDLFVDVTDLGFRTRVTKSHLILLQSAARSKHNVVFALTCKSVFLFGVGRILSITVARRLRCVFRIPEDLHTMQELPVVRQNSPRFSLSLGNSLRDDASLEGVWSKVVISVLIPIINQCEA